jgi:hypothetical protein
MNGHDPHQALKTEVIAQARSRNAQVLLAKLQWSKEDIGFSLHISPNTYTTYGIQTTDFLSMMGFQRSACAFTHGECYWRWAPEDFDVAKFAEAFDQGYSSLAEAQTRLEACGLFLDQPEGWGFFMGGAARSRRLDFSMPGDGHTGMKSQQMKQSEDGIFLYRFTWLEAAHGKGWITHYRPKHPPLSSELESVFTFLRLAQFTECPEFDFESCYWKSMAFQQRDDSFSGSNVDFAHRCFDAHATNFAQGIEKLLAANASIERVGLKFLPFPTPASRLATDIERHTVRPTRATAKRSPQTPTEFDVAISFAGSERQYAQELATILKDAGFSVFYDDFYPEYLWGKNLVDTFDEIFRKRARYCVMFISKEYGERMWTNHERQSAQARALREKGSEYILPIRVDDTELAGMPPTIGYIALEKGVRTIADVLMKKLHS